MTTAELIGRSCLLPGAGSPEGLFELMRQRRCAVTEIPDRRWDKARYWHPVVGTPGKTYTFAAGVLDDIHGFDPSLFGMSPREATSLDPQQRIILQLTWRALEDANLDPGDLRGEKIGVYVGASSSEHGNLIVGDPASASPYFMTGSTLSIVSNRISHVLGLSGPSMTVDTACSSGMVALDVAMRALDSGEIDTAIVGSVNVLAHPLSFVGFAQARMLSPQGLCRAYDNDGAGYVRAEGGVVFILRRSDKAEEHGDRSYARILASGVNSAGRTNGISLPSGEAQAALLNSIYGGGGLDVNRLAFIEGHGTGTRVGDPAEVGAIGDAIGRHRRTPIMIGSVKTNVGHTEPAAGLVGLLKASLALQHNYLPASLHFETPNEHIDFDGLNVCVASEPVELLRSGKPRLAGVNSFGFGGTNAHVVISDPEPLQAAPAAREAGGGLYLASAQSADSLRQLLEAHRVEFLRTPKKDRPTLVTAFGANRPHLKHRFVVEGAEPEAIVRDIERHLDGAACLQAQTGEAPRNQARTAFVFSGNGSQWAGMSVGAYRQNVQFRERFNVVDALFRNAADISVQELLTDPDLDAKLADTRIAQPLLFATQAALADTLLHMGLRPAAVFGHSVGEVAAAYVSGAISLVDAVAVVTKRSSAQHEVVGQGRMFAVSLNGQEAVALARSHGLDNLYMAASNAHGAATLSGPANEIIAFDAIASAARIPGQILDIDYPFHHPLIDSAKGLFLSKMRSFTLHPSQIPFISTVTGAVLEGTELGPEYWWRNIREPVLFREAAEAAIQAGCSAFVEIGPRPILASYLRDTMRQMDVRGIVLPSLQRKENREKDKEESREGVARRQEEAQPDPVSQCFAKAVASGVAFDTVRTIGRRKAGVNVPSIPFQKSPDLRYGRTSEAIDLYGNDAAERSALIGWRVEPEGTVWRNNLDSHLFPDLAEHVVDGRSIMPGSGFLDMAVAAARQTFGDAPMEITNVNILQPLELSSARMVQLTTVVSRETGTIEIRSRERLSEDDWTLHAIARCRPASAAAETGHGVKGRPSDVIEADELYTITRRFGLDYGPAFRLAEKVSIYGKRHLEVMLRAPQTQGNPFIDYHLNPLSVDAVFHGLVSLARKVSGDSGGAPYIPVRFGKIRTHLVDPVITRAVVAIERASASSMKFDVSLYTADGTLAASLHDCRFKRTYLRRHKSLLDQSLHYHAVAAALPGLLPRGGSDALRAVVGATVSAIAEEEHDESTLLLNAAAYRACYDIASAAAGQGRRLAAGAVSGDFALDCFLSACLFRLCEVGLASEAEGTWTIEEECSIPPVDAIIAQLLRERPDRSAEAILLSDAYALALERTRGLSGRRFPALHEDAQPVAAEPSAATLEHFRIHSASARWRSAAMVERLERVLEEAAIAAPNVVELCAMSASVTAKLAEAVSRRDGMLTVVEPDDRLRYGLELALERSPHVRIVKSLPVSDDLLAPDLIVSTSADLFGLIEGDAEAEKLVRATLEAGGSLVACIDAPGVFSDFTLGQSADWFSRSIDAEFPVGKLATAAEWERLVARLGADDGKVVVHSVSFGVLHSLAVSGPARQQQPQDEADDAPTPAPRAVVLHDGGEAGALDAGGAALALVPVAAGGRAESREELAAILADAGAEAGTVIYAPGRFGAEEGSAALQVNVSVLTALAEAIELRATQGAARPRIAVLLPGGSPVTVREGAKESAQPLAIARNWGLWTFLRVLRNEYPEIVAHAFDLAGMDGAGLSDQLDIIAGAMDAPTRNREWLFNPGIGALEQVRALPGHLDERDLVTSDFEAATIRQTVASQTSSIVWEACPAPKPGPGQVCIEVVATALNFRDVMWALGMLPEEALEDGFAGATIGMECSGRLVAVGEGVDGFAVGDKVMAFAPDAFSTHVVAPIAGVMKLPDGIDLMAGATLPVAFLTAYYSLVELAKLQSGETVLIHGGAGGVGLAATQIAISRGATVVATAGTSEKRHLLRTVGAHHVFDSRSLDFAEQVMELTEGRGVDVVLNSLFGEAMEQSIEVLAPFGRFLELGKRDFYADTKIGLRPFRRNISYFGIDADQLLMARPELTDRLFADIGAMVRSEDLAPLPYRRFAHDEIGDAFRLMQGSGHIGKILVTPPKPGRDAVRLPKRQGVRFSSSGVHLVVGGIGGFGLAAADWLVENGARRLALCSRRGEADDQTREALRRWRAHGVEASLHACDVTDEAAVAALLAELREKGPVKGVLHAAMVLDDALMSALTQERNRPVIDTKALGASLLDAGTRGDKLDYFLLFSSATTAIGNPGQSNYVAANGYLEGLARERRRIGLPGLATGFGAISDVGYLTSSEQAKAMLSQRIGNAALTAREALEKVGEYMAQDPGTPDAAVVMIAEVNWAAARALPTVASPLFEVVTRLRANQASSMSAEGVEFAAMIAGKSPKEIDEIVYGLIAEEIANTLRIPVSEISRMKVLREMGLDSLMAMELSMSFQQKTGVDLPLGSIGEDTTVGEIATKLSERIIKKNAGGEQPDQNDSIIDELAARHSQAATAAATAETAAARN